MSNENSAVKYHATTQNWNEDRVMFCELCDMKLDMTYV